MSFPSEVSTYVGRVRAFRTIDWIVYTAWVGMMLGLVFATGGFLVTGARAGIAFPGEAWLVPCGAAVFTGAIAFDTIGHRTVYREYLEEAEGLVHGVTIFCGIASCVLLCAATGPRHFLWVPAMVMTVLSFFYSVVDEAFHWRRYVSRRSDRVEMWAHVFIFIGHGTMMLGWWTWYFGGYQGAAETAAVLFR